MKKSEPIQIKHAPMTFLEIGAGEKTATHLMPKIRPGDRYVAVDVRPLYPYDRVGVKRRGVENLLAHADVFSLPLKDLQITERPTCVYIYYVHTQAALLLIRSK